MHRDKPPGVFELNARPVSYSVWLGLITGFVLSILLHVSLQIWRADTPAQSRRPSATTLEEAAMRARRTTTSPPPPSDAVRYR